MKTIKTFESVLNESGENPSFSTFIGLLFQSRDISHIVHLNTKSYAEHMALNGYYDGLIGLIDSLVEQYQGIYGIIEISIPGSTSTDMIQHLTNLNKEVILLKKSLNPDDGSIMNTVDSIQELIISTLYKLKTLNR